MAVEVSVADAAGQSKPQLEGKLGPPSCQGKGVLRRLLGVKAFDVQHNFQCQSSLRSCKAPPHLNVLCQLLHLQLGSQPLIGANEALKTSQCCSGCCVGSGGCS